MVNLLTVNGATILWTQASSPVNNGVHPLNHSSNRQLFVKPQKCLNQTSLERIARAKYRIRTFI